MHEVSVMTQVVEQAAAAARKSHAKKVETVKLDVGELTFLGLPQLKFAYKVLTSEGILKGSKLSIRHIRGRITCAACGYKGYTSGGKGVFHLVIPLLLCPKCGGKAEISSGRECILRSMTMQTPGKKRGSRKR